MSNIRNIALIFRLAIILGLSFNPAFSENLPDSYWVGNDTSMTLGRAFYPDNLYAAPPSDCFTSDIRKQEGGWSEVRLNSSVVNDYTSLLDSQNISAEVHVQSLTSSVDAKYATSRFLVSNSRNVSIVVQAYAEIPNIVAVNPEIKDEYKAMLISDPTRFVAECGSRMARIEHRGISLSAVITIVEASESLKSKVATSAAASFGNKALSASAKASFDKEIASAKSSNRYEVNVFAQGGPGVASLSELVRATVVSSPNIDEIGAALANYLKDITPENAVRMRFDVADIPSAGTTLKAPWTREKGLLLKHLVDSYIGLTDRRNVLANIANDVDPRFHQLVPKQRKSFRKLLKSHNTVIEKLLQTHSKCMATKPPTLDDCKVLDAEISTTLATRIPPPIQPPRGRYGIAVMENGQWRMLPVVDQDDAFSSYVAGNQIPGYDGPNPTDYLARLARRVYSVSPEATHFAFAYLISADYLSSIELRVNSDNPSSEETRILPLLAWGKADLAKAEFAPYDSVEKTESSSPFNRWIILDVTQLQPTIGPIEPKLLPHVNFGTQTGIAVRHVLKNTMASSGTGRLELVIKDSFSSEPAIAVLNKFSWDRDDALGIAKVDYEAYIGAPLDTFFIPGLSATSASFPILLKQESWSDEIDNATSRNWGGIKDKWNLLQIINCNAAVRVTSLSYNLGVKNLGWTISTRYPDNVQTLVYKNAGISLPKRTGFNAKVNLSYLVLLRGDSVDDAFNNKCVSPPVP